MISEVYGLRLLARSDIRRAVLLLVLGILVIFRLIQFAILVDDPRWGYDFAAYWLAAERVAAGESPYAVVQLAGPYPAEGAFLYLYPPALAAVLAPVRSVAPLGYASVAWLWAAVGAVILAWGVVAVARTHDLARRFEPMRGATVRALLVAAALVLPPVIGELTVGNVHLEIFGLLTAAWLGLRRDSPGGDRVAGTLVGLATVIKVFPGLVIVWFLASRRYAAAAWAVGAVAAAMVGSVLLTGLGPWFDYPRVLANMGAVLNVHDSISPTVWLATLVGFSPARAIITILGLALVVFVARRRPPIVGYAVAVTVAVLISPAVFHHYLAVLVLPLLLALAAGVRPSIVAAAYLLMWGGQQPALGEWAWVLSRVPQTLGWMVLLGGLLTTAERDPRPDRPLVAAPT